MSPRPRHLTRRAAAALSLLLGLTACSLVNGNDTSKQIPSAPLVSSSGPAQSPSTDPALGRFYDQHLQWQPCRQSMQCAHLTVPLDYAHPDGQTIKLAVLKVPATDPSRRVGALVVNPGGPGVSGVDYAASATTSFGEQVRAAFDIVGFDPRGVGSSTPVRCLPDSKLDALVSSDPDPDTPAEIAQSNRLIRELGDGCMRNSGDLARHISTEEAARDIDILRAALGQNRLAYFGASYGTYLGATYADLFPTHVGRMVLDGAVDPTASSVEMALVQAHGFEVALRSYVSDCVSRGGCYLGQTVDEGMQRIRDLITSTDQHPLPGNGTRQLTEGEAVLGIWAPLYNRSYWPALDTALSEAMRGNGRTLLSFADHYVNRGPSGYLDNRVEALSAVNCLDPHQNVSQARVKALEPRFLKASPTFGRVFDAGLTACNDWPAKPTEVQHALHANGAPPIIVIGTTRDPATPLRWARSLAGQLDSGVLVTRNGDGHTGYRAGNPCVDDTVERYLVSGVVPHGTVHC